MEGQWTAAAVEKRCQKRIRTRRKIRLGRARGLQEVQTGDDYDFPSFEMLRKPAQKINHGLREVVKLVLTGQENYESETRVFKPLLSR